MQGDERKKNIKKYYEDLFPKEIDEILFQDLDEVIETRRDEMR